MLADRDYMRDPVRSEPMRATTTLIIANVACFIVFNIFVEISRNRELQDLLYLSKDGLKKGYIWQVLTFQFLHGNLLHLLFNGVGIYVFGRLVEERMAPVRFLQLYFISGIIGGLVQVLGGLFSAKFAGPVIGASAGVSALLAAFSLMFWHQQFKVLLFFFIPIELTGKFLFTLGLAASLIGLGLALIATTPGQSIAHLAHLGGFFAAFLFVSKDGGPARIREWISDVSDRRRQKTLVPAGKARKYGRWEAEKPAAAQEEELPPDQFISKEVDPILDKISSKGIHSLTEQERKILEKARSKMAKR